MTIEARKFGWVADNAADARSKRRAVVWKHLPSRSVSAVRSASGAFWRRAAEVAAAPLRLPGCRHPNFGCQSHARSPLTVAAPVATSSRHERTDTRPWGEEQTISGGQSDRGIVRRADLSHILLPLPTPVGVDRLSASHYQPTIKDRSSLTTNSTRHVSQLDDMSAVGQTENNIERSGCGMVDGGGGWLN